MKKETKRLTFESAKLVDKLKTNIWYVYSDQICLGKIKWWASWRRYCFFPLDDVLFDVSCLMEIVDFITEQMDLRKSKV